MDYSLYQNSVHFKTFLRKKPSLLLRREGLDPQWNPYFLLAQIQDEELSNFLEPDGFYVEGVIFLAGYGRVILSFQHWDLVDQLYAYFINALEELLLEKKQNTTFYFPDQPLKVQLTRKGLHSIVLQVGTDRSKSLPLKEFCILLFKEARYCFARIASFVNDRKRYAWGEDKMVAIEKCLF